MEQTVKSNKKFYTAILFSLISASVALFLIPQIQNLTIAIIQKMFHKVLRNPERWIEIIIHCGFIVISVVWTIYFLIFSKTGKEILQKISSTLDDFFKSIKENKILLCAVFASLFLVFFKIIASNFYYADDLWRNAEGSRSWIGFSRYISEFLSIFIHNSLNLSDIAPLPQFISLAINAVTLFMLCYILNDKKIEILPLLALSVLFISPFYAENISYKFDSPYMALSVFFPVVPFLFIDDKKSFLLVSIISIILTCFSYQAGGSIYILLTIFILLKKLLKNENIGSSLEFAVYAASGFIAAMLIFKLLYMNTMSNSEDDYFSTAIKLSAFPSNLKIYASYVSSGFGGIWLKLFTLAAVAAGFIVLVKDSECKKIPAVIFVLAAFILSFVLSTGPYIIFERPLLTSRVFTGFNLMIALLLFTITKNTSGKILVPLTVYSCIVFQFCYGNCLTQQKEYQYFKSSMIAKDISKFAGENEQIEIKFENSIDFCDAIKVSRKNYPLISKLITRVPSENSIWNENYFTNFNLKFKNNKSLNKAEMILVESNIHYNIYKNNNCFVIELKESK